MGLANRILCDPIAAEDVFIESMTRLLPLVAGFGEPDRFGAYARRAVRNQAVDCLRSRSYRDARRALRDTDRLVHGESEVHPVDRIPAAIQSPETQLLKEERRKMVHEAVEGLQEPRRTVVRLFYEADKTYTEIAEELGISDSSVKRHLGAARVVLAARLRKIERKNDVA